MPRDVEVDSDTVYDWHTMLHLQLYFQGHTGESSVPGMTELCYIVGVTPAVTLSVTLAETFCNSSCNCNYLIHISLNLI